MSDVPMSDTPIISTTAVHKRFRNGRVDTPVLFEINLAIGEGEFLAVCGPSGCGKSTLLHILGQMLGPTSGEVMIEGRSTGRLTAGQRARLRREKIGFIFQRFNLLPTLSAYQNIALPERLRGKAVDGQVTRALEVVRLTDRARHKPGQLSVGQQQRVAIARAICHQPRILLADEPTGNLDSDNSRAILELLSGLHRDHGMTIIMITHSTEAAEVAGRVIHMRDGRILDG